jgi:hypothetical protein
MPSESPSRAPVEVLRAARQRDSAEKRRRVLTAVQDLLESGEPITFAKVARMAGVSTWLAYAPGVREHIERARTRQAARPHHQRQAGTAATSASHQTDLLLAREEIRQLRTQLAELRQGLRHDLGRQLDQLGSRDASLRVAELTRENQRLASAERQAAAENKALTARITELEDDVTAARTSLRRMIRERSSSDHRLSSNDALTIRVTD